MKVEPFSLRYLLQGVNAKNIMAAMLPLPSDTVADCVEIAVTALVASRLGTTLPVLSSKLTQIEQNYRKSASNLHLFPEAKDPAIDDKRMSKLYDNRMVDKRCNGRQCYDKIKTSCSHCMYCLEKTVETLDHFLPRVSDPLLSITPVNLVPACDACNGSKGDDVANGTRGLYVHPYFESLCEKVWLKATVEPNANGEPVLTYYIEELANDLFSRKLVNQFKQLDLANLYSKERAWDLGELSHDLRRFFDLAGSNGVREELQGRLDSSRKTIRLSRTAMLEALSESDWYCNGGFAAYKIHADVITNSAVLERS